MIVHSRNPACPEQRIIESGVRVLPASAPENNPVHLVFIQGHNVDGIHRNERTNAEWLHDLTREDSLQANALRDLRRILLRAAHLT